MKAIPVKYIRFNNLSMEIPGCSSSSMTARCDPGNGRGKKHKAEFHPWVGQLWVELYDRDPDSEDAKLLDYCYVPREMVMHWKPLDGPVPAPSIKRK